MQKRTFLVCALALFATVLLQSCSDNDSESISELEKNFFSIENATYTEGEIPEATTTEELSGIEMSSKAMNGAMNYITVVTKQDVSKFFVGIKNLSGYLTYTPNSSTTRSDDYNTYVIPVMMSLNYSSNAIIILSGQLANGDITVPVENEINYIETMPGAIEIKLAFSNSKDIDLHLYTPSGEHIFYDNRGGTYYDEETNEEITYGLDIDSNAGCYLDNINKENIYIPEELVEDGIYTVVVDMYYNCNRTIATSWSIIARYEGELIKQTSGSNPASGTYQVGAGDGDMTKVMTFTIKNGKITRGADIRSSWKFTPTELTENEKQKIEFSLLK